MLVDWLPLLEGRALVFIAVSPAAGCWVCVLYMLSHSVVSNDPMDRHAPGSSLCPWDFPGKSTGVGCHFLLHGIFLTQGSNPGLLHWCAIAQSYLNLCNTMEWVAISYCWDLPDPGIEPESPKPHGETDLGNDNSLLFDCCPPSPRPIVLLNSCIGRWIHYHWATREAPKLF